MPRAKVTTKTCYNCFAIIPVASKKCKVCKSTAMEENDAFLKKRSIRKTIKKPVFYDSIQYETTRKNKNQQQQQQTNPSGINLRNRQAIRKPESVREQEEASFSKIKAVKKYTTVKKIQKPVEKPAPDLIEQLPPNKQELASIILAELNRKFFAVSRQPA